MHDGVDLTSRPAPGESPKRLDFIAGVHGIVTAAGEGPWGVIAIQLVDGSTLQYLHTSFSYVKVGEIVDPNTKLGVTGKKRANEVHLHVQAKDRSRNPISPDAAFRVGQAKLSSPLKVVHSSTVALNFNPIGTFRPQVVDGVVRISKKMKVSFWATEVIGGGGKVDAVLGRFGTYEEAVRCSQEWSAAEPDDLRLTREREVTIVPAN